MKTKLAVAFLILLGIGGSTFAQGIRFDATTVQEMSTTAIPGTTNVLTVPAAPIVKFCNFPANAVPCTNLATTFTSSTLGTPCNTSTQITLVGSTTCVASPDANGNFGFWAAAGQYAYTVTLPGGINLGPYNVTLGIPAGTNLSIASLTTSGPNNLSGGGALAGTFTGNPQLNGQVGIGELNNVLTVGPAAFRYTTIAAAIASADCPSFGCSIFVRSDATLDASTVSITKPIHVTFDNGNFASAATSSLFSCTTGIEGVRFSGQSRNGTGNSSGTLLSTSGTSTIAFNFTNCPGAELDHFNLSGPGSGTGTANKGVVMAGHDVKMDSVLVTSYGGIPVTFDGTTVNTNDWKFWNSRVQNSGTTGILVTGANANNGVVISSSSGGNLGVGMLVTGTAQFTNIIGLDTAGNAAIGLELNSPNNFVVMFSDAPNAPETAAIQFDAAALNNEIHCLKNAMPINTDNGAGNRYYGCGGTFGAGGSTWNTVNAQFFTAANGLNLTERTALGGSSGTDVMFGDSGDHFIKYNPNNQGEQHLPQVLILTSAYTNATTTFSTVAGGQTFSFPVKASTNYTVDCHFYYQAAATGGLNIQLTGPASPTQLRYAINAPLSVSTNNTATASAFSTSLGAVVTTAATDFDATITAGIVNGVNAGTVTIQAKSSAAVNLTIQPGSYCSIQ